MCDIVRGGGIITAQVTREDAEPVPYPIHKGLMTRYSQRIADILNEWEADNHDGDTDVDYSGVDHIFDIFVNWMYRRQRLPHIHEEWASFCS
ncbi:hypothetical protein E8E11_003896 [Didymella keratinophila]|nr:hypothetical protein E8E11_003896 [Didymella keratinophila]